RGIAWSLNSLGNVVYAQGDDASARALHEESLHIRRELGDRQGMAWSLLCLGNVAYPQGKYTEARAHLGESLRLFGALGGGKGVAQCLGGLAAVRLEEEAIQTAVGLWGAAHALRESTGAPLSPHEREQHDRQVEQARSALGEDAFAAAWEQGRTLNL